MGCCLLQLMLNALSVLNVAHVGCAGFNKVLGPWRTQLRCCTVAWMAGMWILAVRKGLPKSRLVCSSLLAVTLSWLPEILLVLGSGGGGGVVSDAIQYIGISPTLVPWSGVAPSYAGAEQITVRVNGMGCEACQLHVRTQLEMSSGVLSSDVDWRASKANLWINKDWGFNLTALASKLALDGYEIQLLLNGTGEGKQDL